MISFPGCTNRDVTPFKSAPVHFRFAILVFLIALSFLSATQHPRVFSVKPVFVCCTTLPRACSERCFHFLVGCVFEYLPKRDLFQTVVYFKQGSVHITVFSLLRLSKHVCSHVVHIMRSTMLRFLFHAGRTVFSSVVTV